MTTEEALGVYGAVLSTVTALGAGGIWLRKVRVGRIIDVRFSYGWEYAIDRAPRLTIRVHNDSPSAAIHILQFGWKDGHERGDFYDVEGASLLVPPGGTVSHQFTLQNKPDGPIRGTALLGNRALRVAESTTELSDAWPARWDDDVQTFMIDG